MAVRTSCGEPRAASKASERLLALRVRDFQRPPARAMCRAHVVFFLLAPIEIGEVAMTQSLAQARIELLAQHQDLRAKMDATQAAAARCTRGEPAHGELNTCIARLADGLHRHNAREDELLRGIMPTIDAWGPARAEIMNEAHVREHLEVYRALVDAGAASDPVAAATTALRLIEQIAAHMDHEEKSFLGPDVLRDDAGPADPFGG